MCIYCDPASFPNGGIAAKPVRRKKLSGKWHRRVDKRYVKCTGERNQTLVEATLENALVLADQFVTIEIVARCYNGGFWRAGSNIGSYMAEIQPSSPLPIDEETK